jgi:hypothetical protein
MVLLAWAPRVALVVVVVVDVDVEVLVDVGVLLSDLLPEPQPTSATLSATAMVAAVKCFIDQFSRQLGRHQRQPRGMALADVVGEKLLFGYWVLMALSSENAFAKYVHEGMVMQ